MKIRNVMGNRFSGRMGRDFVAVEGPTTDYLREYVVPEDPKTERQLAQRAILAQAVAAWKDLSLAQQSFYDHLDTPRIGYHVFKKRAMHALVAGKPIEVPVRFAWMVEAKPEKGKAYLLVNRGKKGLLAVLLKSHEVEIALTGTDAPFTLVLAHRAREEEVCTLSRRGVAEPPPTLESATLGIRLVPKPG